MLQVTDVASPFDTPPESLTAAIADRLTTSGLRTSIEETTEKFELLSQTSYSILLEKRLGAVAEQIQKGNRGLLSNRGFLRKDGAMAKRAKFRTINHRKSQIDITSSCACTSNHWRFLLHAIVCLVAVLLPPMVFGQDRRPANRPTFNPTFDLSTIKPFTDGELYMDKYKTGLYPDSNEIPKAHQKAGMRIAATIKPLDVDGKPDPNGKILALVMGHSNCRLYFDALGRELKKRADELHPRFELLNAAFPGQQLPELMAFEGPVYDRAKKLLFPTRYSAAQVQILFLHTTYHGAGNPANTPPRPFPLVMQSMQADLAALLEHCLKLYPNLKIAYLTCDGLRHYTCFEPHVWQEAFAFKWLIESQINGDAATAFEGKPDRPRRLPWLQWGPYIWDNTWDRTYFRDGVHPVDKARDIFVRKYWALLSNDPVARPWLLKPREKAIEKKATAESAQ